METKIFVNAGKHLKKICTHKYYVAKYCFKIGLVWQGLTHDLSKFSPVEFLESIQYYQGTRSPIDACKEINGWSKSWLHHKGVNRHHYEHWQDDFDHGGKPLKMPYEYVAEMLCDYLGAAQAYLGKKFTYQAEYEWWSAKKQNPLAMHPDNKLFIERALYALAHTSNPDEILNETYLKKLYDYCNVEKIAEVRRRNRERFLEVTRNLNIRRATSTQA